MFSFTIIMWDLELKRNLTVSHFCFSLNSQKNMVWGKGGVNLSSETTFFPT